MVWSDEPPIAIERKEQPDTDAPRKKLPPGSIAYAPAIAGLMMAAEVVTDLCKDSF